MVFHKIARIVKNIAFMMLSWQGEFLQKRLAKRLGYTKKAVMDGCTVDISQDIKDKLAKVDNDVRAILKQCKNNPFEVIKYLEEHNVPVFLIKHSKRFVKFIKEKEGLITDRTGLTALVLNLWTKQGISFKTKTFVLMEDSEPDIYNLIHCLHKWYAKKEGLLGFDEKSQKLLRKFNDKNEDKLIGRLSIPEIEGLKNAISRDVQAIEFVSKYSRENAGAKKALEKMQTDNGANI